MDLSRIPTADLEALQAGDLSKVSTQTLNYMQRASSPTSQPKATQPTPQDDTPEWAGKHPNLYGMYGAGKALARTGIEGLYTTLGAAGGTAIPIPGATLAGGGVGYATGKRVADQLLGDETDMSVSGVAKDVGVGALMQGGGMLLSKIPGLNKVLSPKSASIGKETTLGKTATDKLSYSMAEKSLKIPPSVKTNVRETATNTLLEEKIPISKGGLKKVRGIMDDLEDQMDAVVANSPNKDNIIKTEDALGPVRELRDKLTNAVGGKKMASELDNIVNELKEDFGETMTVARMQEIKQATNAILKNKAYGSLQNVETETKKQIVRGMKDIIAKEVEGLQGVNFRYSKLKSLEPALERAVNRTGNWDWLSLTSLLGGSVVGGATGNVMKAAEAGTVLRILKSPWVQSQLAISLRQMGVKSKVNLVANSITDSIYNNLTGGYKE